MRLLPRVSTAWLAAACLLAAPSAAASSAAQRPAAGGRVAAESPVGAVTMDELEELLLARHAFSTVGRDALRHLVQTRVIDHLGRTEGVRVTPGQVNRLWDELDRRFRAEGVPGGMAAELARSGTTPEEFREVLRLQIVQQVLTRRALGLPEGAEVSGDQQAVWIDREIQRRGLETYPPPWEDGIVARCGEVVAPAGELAELLREHLPAEDVREACHHLLLARGIEARMPDLSPEAKERALDAEMERRRREAEGGVGGSGLGFEALLAAQGLTADALRADPSVRIAALSRAWVDRKYGEDGLKRVYEDERAFFEDRYGVAVRTRALFLRGAKFENRWNPRTLEEAEAELRALAERATDEAAFAELAGALSEDPASRGRGGDLGWVARGDEAVPPSIRGAIFERLGAGRSLPEGGTVLGPVRLENGAVLLWLAERRDTPGWDAMREHVHHELRLRFLKDVLGPEDLSTYLDG